MTCSWTRQFTATCLNCSVSTASRRTWTAWTSLSLCLDLCLSMTCTMLLLPVNLLSSYSGPYTAYDCRELLTCIGLKVWRIFPWSTALDWGWVQEGVTCFDTAALVTVTEALVLRSLLEDRGCITESIRCCEVIYRTKTHCVMG